MVAGFQKNAMSAIQLHLWDKIVVGGIILFDEYGYHKWSESNAVDKFLDKIKGKYSLHNTNVATPTLYIIKLDN